MEGIGADGSGLWSKILVSPAVSTQPGSHKMANWLVREVSRGSRLLAVQKGRSLPFPVTTYMRTTIVRIRLVARESIRPTGCGAIPLYSEWKDVLSSSHILLGCKRLLALSISCSIVMSLLAWGMQRIRRDKEGPYVTMAGADQCWAQVQSEKL